MKFQFNILALTHLILLTCKTVFGEVCLATHTQKKITASIETLANQHLSRQFGQSYENEILISREISSLPNSNLLIENLLIFDSEVSANEFTMGMETSYTDFFVTSFTILIFPGNRTLYGLKLNPIINVTFSNFAMDISNENEFIYMLNERNPQYINTLYINKNIFSFSSSNITLNFESENHINRNNLASLNKIGASYEKSFYSWGLFYVHNFEKKQLAAIESNIVFNL